MYRMLAEELHHQISSLIETFQGLVLNLFESNVRRTFTGKTGFILLETSIMAFRANGDSSLAVNASLAVERLNEPVSRPSNKRLFLVNKYGSAVSRSTGRADYLANAAIFNSNEFFAEFARTILSPAERLHEKLGDKWFKDQSLIPIDN